MIRCTLKVETVGEAVRVARAEEIAEHLIDCSALLMEAADYVDDYDRACMFRLASVRAAKLLRDCRCDVAELTAS